MPGGTEGTGRRRTLSVWFGSRIRESDPSTRVHPHHRQRSNCACLGRGNVCSASFMLTTYAGRPGYGSRSVSAPNAIASSIWGVGFEPRRQAAWSSHWGDRAPAGSLESGGVSRADEGSVSKQRREPEPNGTVRTSRPAVAVPAVTASGAGEVTPARAARFSNRSAVA